MSLKSTIPKEKNSFFDKLKLPHTLVIIITIMFIVSLSTYFIPEGAYDKVLTDNGKSIVLDGSFKYIESQLQGIFDILKA